MIQWNKEHKGGEYKMQYKEPIQLDERIHLIDGCDVGLPEKTGTYVIHERDLTLIETRPSPSVKHIKQGLEHLGISLGEMKYIVGTNIDQDHAGGARLLLRDCPSDRVVVHPRGKRHLAAPEKLMAGARAGYGDNFSDLFDLVIPIPEERLLVKNEGG